MESPEPAERPSGSKVSFDPIAFELCLTAAQDQLQRIVHELFLLRRRRDVTQADLAAALDMNQSRISEIERLNNTDFSLMRILLIAEAFGQRLELRVADADHGIFKDPKRAVVASTSESNQEFVDATVERLVTGRNHGPAAEPGVAYVHALTAEQTEVEKGSATRKSDLTDEPSKTTGGRKGLKRKNFGKDLAK